MSEINVRLQEVTRVCGHLLSYIFLMRKLFFWRERGGEKKGFYMA